MILSNHLILCCPLLCFPSVFPNTRDISKELAICIRWTKYRCFSRSIHASYEYSVLIIFRIDWFDLLCSPSDSLRVRHPGTWASQSITMNKASGGDRISAELFKILKVDAVKVLQPICQQIWKTQQWPQDWKRTVFIPIPKKDNAKEYSSYHTIALISHASKVMFKILQARLQQHMNWNLQMYKQGLEKEEERQS